MLLQCHKVQGTANSEVTMKSDGTVAESENLQIKKDRRLRRMLSQDAKRGRLLTHKIFCTQKSEVHRQEMARAMLSDDGLA